VKRGASTDIYVTADGAIVTESDTPPRFMPVSNSTSVYGGYDGRVAFLELPRGVIPPPHIDNMTYLGPPYDLITTAVNYFHARELAAVKSRPAPQKAVAKLLGVRQQSVSRWMNAVVPPRLSLSQWSALVRVVIEAHGG
jgi:hypothetical protein